MQNMYSEGTRRIERSILVSSTPDELLDLLSNPARLPEWFAEGAQWIGDHGNGQEAIRIEWHRHGRVIPDEILITERQPFDGERAVFAMRWEASYPRGNSPLGYDTIARFELRPEGTGTRIVLNETGFGDGSEWDFAIRRQSLGWDVYLNALAQHVGIIPTRAITAVKMMPAAAGQVWHAMTTAERIGKWINEASCWDARLGGHWEMLAGEAVGRGWFTHFDPYRELGMSWSWYEAELAPTHARLRLAATEDGTLVTVMHHGWGFGAQWDHELDDCRNGWSACLNGLRKLVSA
jgi:uncharacterized protein YndB with AHSA1/START domain